MALTKHDLFLIKDLLVENNKHLRIELHIALDQQSQDIKRDIRDEMDARFLASETKMTGLFRHELQAVIDILLTFVPERFEKLENDVARIKTPIKLA